VKLLKKGYIHLYTGNGKGKTTAAIGLAVRAIGAGLKVFLCQFMKKEWASELRVLEKLKGGIEIIQCGLSEFCTDRKNPPQEQVEAAQEGFKKAMKAVKSKNYDIVILDEINVALYYSLLSLEQVESLIKDKSKKIELILTGRYAHKKLYKFADLVTEMKEVKHYYTKGVQQRKGIEY